MPDLILWSIAAMFAYATLWYGLSLVLKRNDIADIAWGLGYILVCAIAWVWSGPTPLRLIVYGLITLWGLRLALHIAIRTWGKAEDFRYQNWRKEWGKTFYWRSYVQVYLLQAGTLLVVSAPVYVVALAPEQPLTNWSVGIGVTLWFIGFFFQAVGDWQLARFVKTRTSREEVLQTGLWRYSRHPNYFGEIAMWWGLWVLVLPLSGSVWALVSPLLITWLLLRVSGIPMLEERYRDNPAYQDYQRRTSAWFPWWPKD